MQRLEVLSSQLIGKVASRTLAYRSIRRALVEAHAARGSKVFDVSVGHGSDKDSMVAVKSGLTAHDGVYGLKVGSYWPHNATQHAIPNHSATTLLLDPQTGLPQALFNATALNGLRTAAANAVATDVLSRQDASTLLVLGAGHQARYEIAALCQVRPINRIFIWSPNNTATNSGYSDALDVPEGVVVTSVSAADLPATAAIADLVTTVTPAKEPLLKSGWITNGTHISAMGADKKGKQELDVELVMRAQVFADNPLQSVEIGELQHASRAGRLHQTDITAIGAVLDNSAPGREEEDSITVFDSSGIALQDICIASDILAQARERGFEIPSISL